MNRIEELAEQAGCSIDGMGYGEGNIEQFASLIIEECSEYLRTNGSAFLVQGLKERFGVEE